MRIPLILSTLIAISTGMALFVQASEKPYYSADLDTAVQEAEKNPSNTKHVGNRWYNRSTSKSFDFPKLLNKEMQIEVVDGALDATASGPGETAPERKSPLELSEQDAMASERDNVELELLAINEQEEVVLSLEPEANIIELAPKIHEVDFIQHSSENFEGSASNIRSESSSRAYITPEN